jgi:spore maturation protein CgeB
MRIVFIGLSITSSWGNGHATTYRGLVRALDAAGHHVVFLERDVPWYRANRDLPRPPYGETHLYDSVAELQARHRSLVRAADVVVVGSFVPDGVAVARWVLDSATGAVMFYDIDTPATLEALDEGNCEYLAPELIPHFDAYLSFTGGPILARLKREYQAPQAFPLYCSVDPEAYPPAPDRNETFLMGYLGTYSVDRQPGLERLLLEPARRLPENRFIVAGPQYPGDVAWPANVARRDHVPPAEHPAFYHEQAFTVNVTRAAMTRSGYAPSVRLFEAASTGTPVVSDYWPGLEAFFRIGSEIVVAASTEEVLLAVETMDEAERRRMAGRARARVLGEHTPKHRARTFLRIAGSLLDGRKLAHA